MKKFDLKTLIDLKFMSEKETLKLSCFDNF